MAKFALLNEEAKIMRRKEKEEERQVKLQERLKEGFAKPVVGNWADASEDEEDEKLFRPVSDSESEKSDVEDDWEAKAEKKEIEERAESSDKAKSEAPVEVVKPDIKMAKKKKPQQSAQAAVKDLDDLDDIFAELGVEVKASEEEAVSAAAARRRKKKEKAAEKEGDENVEPQTATATVSDVVDKPIKAEAQEETAPANPSEEAESARLAALEAMRRKQNASSKNKKATSDSQKYALAEAKKRASKKKTDKSAYDR